MLFISYSCNGQVTEKAKDIGIKISKTQDIQSKIKYMNELMFPPNYKLSKRLNSKHIETEKFVGARQSNFLCKGERILLTEIFFKDINRFI